MGLDSLGGRTVTSGGRRSGRRDGGRLRYGPRMAAGEPPNGRTQRQRSRIFWVCAVLTVMIGVFLVSDVSASADRYDRGAWVGVAISTLVILGLTAVYVGCAIGRYGLEQRVIGRFTLFQATAIGVVAGVGADILIPDRDTGGLALLLPWGISYWLHNLDRPPG